MGVKPGYKRTEVGVIPEEWAVKPLSDLSAFITKGSTPTTYGFKWEQDGILFLRSECVGENGLDLDQSMFISPAAQEMLRRSEARDGDLLITITGNVGRIVELTGVGLANLNQHIARVRITEPSVVASFVFHYLSQRVVRRHFETITTGQAYPQISLQQVRAAEVPVPSIEEQRAIATALSDVDSLLTQLDRLIAKKRDIKQAAMQQLLTGKTRLPGFDGEWSRTTLGALATFFKGKGLPKDHINEFAGEPCIHYGELFTHYSETITEVRGRTTHTSSVFRSEENDVLMPTSDVTPTGLAKASCVRANRIILGGDILVIRTDNRRVDGSFLSYLIRSSKDQILQLVTGTTVFHLYGSDMAKFELLLPSRAEQTAIATLLSDLDAELTALEARRDKTRALKQGMMQELLTGRTRLI